MSVGSSAAAENTLPARRIPQQVGQFSAPAATGHALPADLQRILRLREVEVMTGCKKTYLYDAMRRNEFPRAVPLGKRARGWLLSDVMAWIEGRTALRDSGGEPC